jgi:hypothetical protein
VAVMIANAVDNRTSPRDGPVSPTRALPQGGPLRPTDGPDARL